MKNGTFYLNKSIITLYTLNLNYSRDEIVLEMKLF